MVRIIRRAGLTLVFLSALGAVSLSAAPAAAVPAVSASWWSWAWSWCSGAVSSGWEESVLLDSGRGTTDGGATADPDGGNTEAGGAPDPDGKT